MSTIEPLVEVDVVPVKVTSGWYLVRFDPCACGLRHVWPGGDQPHHYGKRIEPCTGETVALVNVNLPNDFVEFVSAEVLEGRVSL